MNKSRVKPGFPDLLVIGICLLIVIFFSVFSLSKPGDPDVIIKSGSTTWVYPIDSERIIEVPGLLGITEIHIENNSVFFESSPCPGKSCLNMKQISLIGEWIACLPNGVMVCIEGRNSEKNAIDTISK